MPPRPSITSIMSSKSGFIIAGIVIPLIAVLVGLTNQELRCFFRLDATELCQSEFADIDLIIQSAKLTPVPEVEVRFIFRGAPEVRRTDNSGYSAIRIPRRGDIEVILSKKGFETVRHIINLGNDPNRTRTYQLKELTSPTTPTPTPSPIPSPLPSPTSSLSNSEPPPERLRINDYSGRVTNRSCSLASEAEYLNGKYSIDFTYRGVRYEGLLEMYGGIGIMVVNFYSERVQGVDSVKQTMVLANCTQGLLLLGFEPVLPDTNEQHPSYSADNILIRQNVDGSVEAANCDDQEQCSRVEISRIE